jgi:hypothetical protein
VPGAEAAKFDFTSSLAAELLKIVNKSIIPLIEASGSELAPTFPDVRKEDLQAELGGAPGAAGEPARVAAEPARPATIFGTLKSSQPAPQPR